MWRRTRVPAYNDAADEPASDEVCVAGLGKLDIRKAQKTAIMETRLGPP